MTHSLEINALLALLAQRTAGLLSRMGIYYIDTYNCPPHAHATLCALCLLRARLTLTFGFFHNYVRPPFWQEF